MVIGERSHLRASGMTIRFILSYGGGTPSYALSLASAASPLLVLWGIILWISAKQNDTMSGTKSRQNRIALNRIALKFNHSNFIESGVKICYLE